MKGIVSLAVAMTIFAAFNVFVDQKLRGVMQVASMSIYMSTLLTLSVVAFFARGQLELSGSLPTGEQVLWLLGVGGALFVADWLMLTAYNEKVPLFIITTFIMAVPVIASIFKFFLDGGVPTLRQCFGYLFVAGGMFLLVKE